MWADIELHALIAKAASNAVLERLLESIAGMGIASRRRTGRLDPVRLQSAHDHRVIVTAIAAHEPDARVRRDAAALGERRTGGDGMIETPGKIVAIGLNYLDHVRESGATPPEKPLVFAKFTTSLIGDGDEIRIPSAITERVDWEVELAVVIDREARDVSEADALSYVRGYTVANDVSARDVQFADGQWVRAKSLDTFCPLGSELVQVDDPQDLG